MRHFACLAANPRRAAHAPRRRTRGAVVLALLTLVAVPPGSLSHAATAVATADAGTPVTTPATSQPPVAGQSASAAQASAPVSGSDNERVCRKVRDVGSHISKRVCRTRAEMAAESETARTMLEQRDRSTNAVRSGEGG